MRDQLNQPQERKKKNDMNEKGITKEKAVKIVEEHINLQKIRFKLQEEH